MFTMPLAPLVVNKTSGDWMWTAASVLALRTPKLQFDPVLDINFDVPDNENVKNSGLSMLERYVSKLLEASFDDSPLFWHYAMRHVPSPSLVCARDYYSSLWRRNSTITFVNDARVPSDAQNPDILQSVSPTTSIPVHGYSAFPLGAAKSMCFCGWPALPGTLCRIPNATCVALGFKTCAYDPGTQEGQDILATVVEAWATHAQDWECPELDLSDAWGIMSAKDSDAWIASGSTSMKVSELLRAGRAGLRAGNAKTLAKSARADGIWPSARVRKLLPADDLRSTGVALNRCSDTILQSFDAASVAKEVVDDLFPVAQGVHESAPMSACLRFAIEFSRLRVLRAMQSVSPLLVEAEVMLQKSVVDRWKGRWGVYVHDGLICNHLSLGTWPPKHVLLLEFLICNHNLPLLCLTVSWTVLVIDL